jgi:hypothetical protein
MDPFHERLARVALRAAGQYGFALAGGYAIQAHGFLDRLSADVDLFAPSSVEADFTTSVDAVIKEFGRDGLAVDVEIRNVRFARLSVASGSDRSKVEMGVDYGVTPDLASALKRRMSQWAREIRSANHTDGN